MQQRRFLLTRIYLKKILLFMISNQNEFKNRDPFDKDPPHKDPLHVDPSYEDPHSKVLPNMS
jgi:hypothetical protein